MITCKFRKIVIFTLTLFSTIFPTTVFLLVSDLGSFTLLTTFFNSGPTAQRSLRFVTENMHEIGRCGSDI